MLAEIAIGAGLTAICVIIHTTGLTYFAHWLRSRREEIERKPNVPQDALLLTGVFGVILCLHFSEANLWAVFYHWQKLFPNYETSLYFSLISFTTIGFGDVVLPPGWRLLGSFEGLTGLLLSGLSVAFIFFVLNRLFQIRADQVSEIHNRGE